MLRVVAQRLNLAPHKISNTDAELAMAGDVEGHMGRCVASACGCAGLSCGSSLGVRGWGGATCIGDWVYACAEASLAVLAVCYALRLVWCG